MPFSLIPFKGRQPGSPTPPEDRPKHEVVALPERKSLEIRFPVVEGYVASLRKHRISCDLDNVERTSLDPWDTPTAVFVRPQVGYQIGHPSAFGGFGFEAVDRQEYYESVHPQTIEFAIAGEITRDLTEAAGNGRPPCESRRMLFPQVLRIVQDYIRERVDLNGLHPCDVGLQTYAMRIVGLLTAAITPDESRGEPPLLPRLNRYRRVGSTASVHFKTVKPVQATAASHLNYVACDTEELGAGRRVPARKAGEGGTGPLLRPRNDRLEFNIPYELYGTPRVYEPDFIVQMTNGANVVVEIKGRPDPDVDAKNQAAKRWISAVNHWGQPRGMGLSPPARIRNRWPRSLRP